MKKKINKRIIIIGILTAITVFLFATVIVVYGKNQDRKAAEAEAFREAKLRQIHSSLQKAAPVVTTVDVVDEVAASVENNPEKDEPVENNEEEVAAEEDLEEDYYEEDYYEEDYTGIMAAQYNLGTGIYGFSSRDAYVLACVVSAEVGDQDYECQLAVANVVIHRGLNLGGGPGAIEEAVYQPCQFEVAYNSMQDYLVYGPQEDAIRATQDALNGVDNVPGYEHFCYYTIMDGYLGCDGGTMIGSEWFYY